MNKRVVILVVVALLAAFGVVGIYNYNALGLFDEGSTATAVGAGEEQTSVIKVTDKKDGKVDSSKKKKESDKKVSVKGISVGKD